MKNVVFTSCSSISAWAGRNNGIKYLGGDKDMPFIEKDGSWYYFSKSADGYRLIMSATFNLNEEKRK